MLLLVVLEHVLEHVKWIVVVVQQDQVHLRHVVFVQHRVLVDVQLHVLQTVLVVVVLVTHQMGDVHVMVIVHLQT